MTTHAFIFARGGSKGLPGKNIKLLAGKPLLQYSIEVAKASPSVSEVFVSTDDIPIANVAKRCGAQIIQRPQELATDTSAEWLSWRHAVRWVLDNYGPFDNFVSLPATSPLRAVEDVESSLEQLRDGSADICISVTSSSRSPFFNMVKKNDKGFVELVGSSKETFTRRQDAPQVFDLTTVVYATTPRFILEGSGIFSGNVTAIQVPKSRSIDIDDIYDFKFAEILLAESNEFDKN